MRCYKIDMKGLLQVIYTFVRYLRNILVQEDETLSYIFAHPQSYVVSKNIDDKIELGVKIHKKINQFPFFQAWRLSPNLLHIINLNTNLNNRIQDNILKRHRCKSLSDGYKKYDRIAIEKKPIDDKL